MVVGEGRCGIVCGVYLAGGGMGARTSGLGRGRRPRGSGAAALEARACILPVQRHGEALQEHDSAGVGGLELACSRSGRFGKLGPDTPGRLAPSSTHRFDDHGDEGDALC